MTLLEPPNAGPTSARVGTANVVRISLVVAAAILGASLAIDPLVGVGVAVAALATLASMSVWRMFQGAGIRAARSLEAQPELASDWPLWTLAICLPLLAITGPWLVAMGLIRGGLAAVNLVLCAGGFVTGFRPRIRPIRLIWFCFQLSWLGIAPVYQISHDLTNWGDGSVWMHIGALDTALLLNTLSTSAALVGFSVGSRRVDNLELNKDSRTLGPAPWICLFVASVLCLRVLSVVGGLGGLFTSRAQFGSALNAAGINLATQGGVGYALVHILPGAVATAASLLFLKRFYDGYCRGISPRVWELAGFLLALLLAFMLDNPWASARQVVAASLGSIALFIWQPRTRRAGLLLAGIALFAILLVYPLANSFKASTDSGTLGLSALASPDFDGMQEWVNTIGYVHALGHSYGVHTLSALLYFVPRSIWHGKAVPASLLVARQAGYIFTNVSLPLQAEMYLEFGPVGMIIAVALGCYLLGVCDRAWLYSRRSKLAALTPFLALATLPIIRGPLGGNVPFPLTVLVILAFCIRQVPASAESSETLTVA